MDEFNKIELAQRAIVLARKYLDDDPHLANYILRDLELAKDLELDGILWAAHRTYNIHKNDLLYIIEELEKGIKEESEKGVAQ